MRAPRSLSALRRAPGERPWVLGHRGARHAAPENTLCAFELSLAEGAEGVELDVRLDGAGRAIVLHDAGLERVTAGADGRNVRELSAAELAAVRVAGSEPVPLLADVFDWARERAARVNVELKSDVASLSELVDAVVRDVRRAGALPELVFFSSFHPWLVRSTAAALPAFCSCWLVHAKQQAFRAASLFWSLGAVGVNPEHVLVTQARMTRWQHAGALVNTWTVNEPARAIELSELGVDAIISDTPGAIVKALGRQSAGGAS